MKHRIAPLRRWLGPILLWLAAAHATPAMAQRQRIELVGIPLADHYAAIVAYEKYRGQMQHADFRLKILSGPDLVRAYFLSEPEADAAMTVAPMVMDMFAKKPDFRWVSLVHRDGNALVINEALGRYVQMPPDKAARMPDARVADGLRAWKRGNGQPIIAVPSPLSTHATVLYKYLKDNHMTLGLRHGDPVDVLLRIVKPPASTAFLKQETARNQPAAFEQSLPWPEIAETSGFGHVAWYSKDVMKYPKGHVECVLIAKNSVIADKRDALQEVITAIHRAGLDIEIARKQGGKALDDIVTMVQRHIPAHTRDAIIASMELSKINYLNLNVDLNSKESFRQIMDLAYEAGFIHSKIDINALADDSFSTEITKQ
ncbi:ABC transporter substrate-binding protein [Candidatus Symbiobacter mobilis]|uniref:ABC-type transporter periplasmic subunit n=1 Tax=Candidatus Symbiobacter mobilis CR TaxID=946483 RepID=U5NAV9_9BURK|nr:ABC transporter substrate-binding protein [Candidatus Symbiobacter mobilis]AGX87358.1 ABC-type transporter periplasmic subunit [Candidatus Symbiobacter mobilis CR]